MASVEPRPITLEAGGDGEGPRLVSATLLPHRAMMLYQLTADVPGLGTVELLESPPLAEGLRRLDGGPDDFAGNASFSMGGAFLLPFVNRLRGRQVPGERAIDAPVAGRELRLPANWGGKRPGAEQYAMHGLMRTQAARDIRQGALSGAGAWIEAHLPAGDFGGCWLSATDVGFAFRLTPQAFEARITATNAGDEPLPMAIGWHPYIS